ncbi:MAG TPA: glycosyltransferase family 4 protein [Armatimonadota bacterium]|jgi:glycosyltransferase involved in cell wall biosynthesis
MAGEQKRLQIALVNALDPQNRRAWSGTLYFVMQALQQHCGDVTPLGPAPYKPLWARMGNQVSRRLLHKTYDYLISPQAARHYARIFEQRLREGQFDLVVAVDADVEISMMRTDLPIAYLNDTTYFTIVDYYPQFKNLLRVSERHLKRIAHLAIAKPQLFLYSSDWAARSAIEDFGIDPARVHTILFGANLDTVPDAAQALRHQPGEICRLLFIGRYWERKGGDIALETLLVLERLGVPAQLTLVGCIPPAGIAHPHLQVIPNIDKRDPAQRAQMEALFQQSHFFVLPTRADCTPMVFCEANANGLPVITTDTGGVTSVIRDGDNGRVLPFEARGRAYAEAIAEIYRDENRYRAMVRNSRRAYDERLNWDAWGAAVRPLLERLVAEHTLPVAS